MQNNILPKTIKECDQAIHWIQTLKKKIIQKKKDSFKIGDKIIYRNMPGIILSIEDKIKIKLDKSSIENTIFPAIIYKVNVTDVYHC